MGLLTDPFMDRSGNGANGAGATPFAEESERQRLCGNGRPRSKQRARRLRRDLSQGAARPRPSFRAGACGRRAMAARRPPTAMRRWDRTTRPAASPARRSAPTIASRRTRWPALRSPAAAPISVVNGFGSGRSDLFQAGAYRAPHAGPAYISAALAYGWQDITTNRTVTIAGIDQLQARVQRQCVFGPRRRRLSLRHAMDGGVTPYAAAQFTTFDLPAYAEQAIVGSNMFALAYGARDVTDTPQRTRHPHRQVLCDDELDPHAARPLRLGARLRPRPQHRRHLPDAAGRVLRRQRRGAGASTPR